MRNLTNFDPRTGKCPKFALYWDAFDQSIYCTRGVWQIFTTAIESLKIGTLLGSFYAK